MQTAAYTTVKTKNNGEGKYPLSTQTLEFIQQQILLIQQASAICGSKVIVKEPDGTTAGLLVLDGELLYLASTPKLTSQIKYVIVKTDKNDIVADGETYKEARIYRTARFSASLPTKEGEEYYKIGDFQKLTPNTTLAEKIKNLPATVLEYLSDTLASKLDRITLNGATQAQIDGLKNASMVNCTASVSVQGYTDYCITVKCVGTMVEQRLTTKDAAEYYRSFNADTKQWSSWVSVTDNLHIEVKTAGGTLFVRHGVLPADAKILFLRKKKRSGWRSTGGSKAYTKNQGKREKRLKKLQYVHYKGVVLSKGEPGKWYVPKCVSISDRAVDSNLIDREVSSIAGQLVKEGHANKNGGRVLKLAGVRKCLTKTETGKNFKRSGYINLAVQVAKVNAKGGKDAGGELARFKLRVFPKKVYTDSTKKKYTHVYIRAFSVE